MYKEPDISSSYKKVPVFGEFLYDYVMKNKPQIIIEFGTRYGYSAICMGQALRDLGRGHLYTYDDLSQEGVIQKIRIEENIDSFELGDYVTFQQLNLYEWLPIKFDLLHIDINNDGDVLRYIKDKFHGKHVIFEGGIPLRDQVGDKEPMVGAIKYKVLIWDFPGLSKLV